MFMHYSIILIVLKQKKYKTDQENYNNLFFCIENNLRELGFGDISVNKKMKDLNKFFYDILLKINLDNYKFKMNKALTEKYFVSLNKSHEKLDKFELYFNNFYKFCFDISPENMLRDIIKYNI